MVPTILAEVEGNGDMLWLVLLVATAATLICVGLHYETIRLMVSTLHRKQPSRTRPVLVAVVLVLMAVHLVQACVFALAYHALWWLAGQDAGRLAGGYDASFGDSLYFSLTAFTTVGFGDIYPQGPVRILVGVEALAGFVLITWSASFTFLMMQKMFSRDFDLESID